jgi:hypothetical protein
MMIAAKDIDDSVDSIIVARSKRQPLRRLPPSGAPLSVDDAYSIQEAFARRCGLAVAGYKIGCASKESQALVKAAGPIHRANLCARPLRVAGRGLGAGFLHAWRGGGIRVLDARRAVGAPHSL